MNMRKIGSVIMLAFLVLPLASKDKFVQSKWTAAPIQLDAQTSEWTPEEMIADDSLGAKFAVRNDAGYLYLLLSLDDPQYQSSVDQTGITFWINGEMKNKKIHGLHFYKKAVTADQLIQKMESEGQSVTEEQKAKLKTQPQYQIYACDVVNKKGEAVPHPGLAGNGTFRMAQIQKSKVYEFVFPLGLLDDPEGKLKIDPAKPFKFGVEWGGTTEEMKRALAAKLGDRGVQASGAGASEDYKGENDFRAPGGELSSMRRGLKKQYSFWVEMQVAPKQ